MSFSIGRWGLDIPLREPSSWQESGNQVTAVGTAVASTKALAMALRDQGLGLDSNPDEKSVPVISVTDTNRIGYFRDVKVQASTLPVLFKGSFHFPWSVAMTRVQGSSAPQTEPIIRGADRVGKPAGVTAVPWWAITTNALNIGGTPAVSALGTRTASGATMNVLSVLYTSTASALVLPANWYEGASTLTVDSVVVVGRQINASPTGWQVDNGLLKVVYGAATHNLDLYIWSGGGWVGPTQMTVGQFNAGPGFVTAGTPQVLTVIRNSPEEVAIRLGFTISYGTTVTVTLTLRRGSRFVSVRSEMTGGGHAAVGFPPIAPLAMAHIDGNLGGNRKTTNDANGNRGVILYAGATVTDVAEDLANGFLYAVSNIAPLNGAVGIELAGSGSATPDRAIDMRDQYHAAVTETTNIVAR